MALSIKDPDTERLARIIAARTGESLTVATRRALEERLRRLGDPARKIALLEDLKGIRRRWSATPILDAGSADEIIGYDENGLPRQTWRSTLPPSPPSRSTRKKPKPSSAASPMIPSA